MKEKYRRLQSIFEAGLARVNPINMMEEKLKLKDEVLRISTEDGEEFFDLSKFQEIIVLGAGKASARMALGLEKVLGRRISGGLIAVKEGHSEKLESIEVIESGHPAPDKRSIEAGRRILERARKCGEDSLVIVLISGGGSAILSSPFTFKYGGEERSIQLEEMRKLTGILLASGATINEINCIRKHLSGIKGGRLAQAIAPSQCVTLILSDVIGDDLATIASGLTVGDPTTFVDALEVVKRYHIEEKLPDTIRTCLSLGAEGKIEESPKPDSPVFLSVKNILLGTNRSALIAASERAKSYGYRSLILTSHLYGEAREAAKWFMAVAQDILKYKFPLSLPACIIAGGETTVTLRAGGKGGRNQEMALAFLEELRYKSGSGIYFLSAATDGNDGPTDASGAFASAEILDSALKTNIDPTDYLNRNDSYHFFEKTGFLLKTGPTNTNVCDLQVLLVESEKSV